MFKVRRMPATLPRLYYYHEAKDSQPDGNHCQHNCMIVEFFSQTFTDMYSPTVPSGVDIGTKFRNFKFIVATA